MFYILDISDILINLLIVLIFFISMYRVSFIAIKGNKEDTEYTKNVKLTKKRKLILGFFFYKDDKVEIEAIVNQILNYILTIIFIVASLYIELKTKIVGICYIIAMFSVLVGGLIYRFKNNDFKNRNDHY